MIGVELFGGPVCAAAPSEITEGSSTLAVVAHRSGCAFLIERTRDRWPLCPAGLPDTPARRRSAN